MKQLFQVQVENFIRNGLDHIRVRGDQRIYVPLLNQSKLRTNLRVGTLIGSYTVVDEKDIQVENPCRKTKVINDLIPSEIEMRNGKDLTREQKLKQLLSQQDYSHLTDSQQNQLHEIIYNNDKQELGKCGSVIYHSM